MPVATTRLQIAVLHISDFLGNNTKPREKNTNASSEHKRKNRKYTGNKNPPEIIFSGDMPDGTYGGCNPATNTIEINENMLSDSTEAADTIAQLEGTSGKNCQWRGQTPMQGLLPHRVDPVQRKLLDVGGNI